MDPKTSAEPSVSADKESERTTNATSVLVDKVDDENSSRKEHNTPSVSASASASNLDLGSTLTQGDETGTKTEESGNPASVEVDKGRKSSTHFKSSPGKRKMKVDWTPELHRQFVKAVEQLGVDKAVPSKILEIMGIDCLTRHNVASHLQKYRSHRKHLLAREAETASWRRRRQTCGTSGGVGKRDPDSWVVPTTGFPPVTPMPHYRPLHVWGHPSANQSLMYMWPQPTPTWVPVHQPSPPVLGDSSFWYYHHQDVPAQGMPYLLPHYPPTGCPTPPVQGITPTSMYRVDPGIPAASNAKMLHQPSYDFYLSKESVDRALGDVLSKPWLPLPLGLKPPSIDTVMVELHRQGISKIPPGLS